MIDEQVLLSKKIKKKQKWQVKKNKSQKKKNSKRGKRQFDSALSSMFPIRVESDFIVTREGVTDIFRLENFAIRKEPQHIQQEAIRSLIQLFRGVKVDVKIFLKTFDVKTQTQQDYLNRRKTLGELSREGQELSSIYLKELVMSEQSMPQEISYFQLFAKDEVELTRARFDLDTASSLYTNIKPLTVAEKKAFYYELHNIGETAPTMSNKVSQKEALTKDGCDLDFMRSIQPEGGIRKKGDYFLQTSRGYQGCMKLHEWSTKFDFFYGASIFRHTNIMTTIDLLHREKSEVLGGMNRTLNDKKRSKPKDEIDRKQLQKETQLLDSILEDVVNGNEQVKEVMVRYYLVGKTKDKIWEQAEAVNSRLQPLGYKASFCAGRFLIK
ncbi:hypothetical protein RyT2_28220 [Pseudolactococcus yaeyamensis]